MVEAARWLVLFLLMGLVAHKLSGEVHPGVTELVGSVVIRGLWWTVATKESGGSQG